MAKVVVAETSLLVRELAKDCLEESGHVVLTAGRGHEVLPLVVKEKPDLLVLDCHLPDMSGQEICRRLREAEAKDALPIIVCAISHPSDHWFSHLANGYLIKPYAMVDLAAKVAGLLAASGRRPLGSSEEYGKSDSWSTFSHHLRNGIGTIASVADFCQHYQLEPDKLKVMLVNIYQSAKETMGFVEDLSRFVRALEPRPKDLAAEDWLRQVVAAHPVSSKTDIAKEWRVESSASLRADPEMLARAVGAVLSNALEAMPKGGQLLIGLAAKDRKVRISLENSGPQLPPKVLTQAWEPLFTSKPGQRGLGLSWARKIVEALDGAVALANVPGKGVLVTFTLPAAQP